MMGGNAFYSNAEAYAFEILQQKLIKEAQKSAQQTLLELSALKSFLGQGQLLYCIPFGGIGLPTPFPFYPLSAFTCGDPNLMTGPDFQHQPALPSPSTPSSSSSSSSSSGSTSTSSGSSTLSQSIVHVNVKNAQGKHVMYKPGSDECKLGKDGIDVTIDLREYLPAEICLNVEEKLIEIKACHMDTQGSKTFARRYDLPACIILDSVRCILTHDGFLLFSAAWCKME